MAAIQVVRALDALPDVRTSTAGTTRTRDVYTNADRRLFDRASKMLNSHGDRLQLRCGATLCPDRIIRIVQDAAAEGGVLLRCGCTDRVFSRGI